jgi:4-hydroxy-tetrahydrodipicolinate synthase
MLHSSSGWLCISEDDALGAFRIGVANMLNLSGVVPAIGTPLENGDRVDEQSLRRLARYLLDSEVNGILANGSMGGFAFLTDDEQTRAISIVVSEVDGKIPVMGGIGETSTVRAVKRAKEIAGLGVTHLSLLAPFYYFATQDNLISYFSEIAGEVNLPIFLYDNPVMTKNYILPETVAHLRNSVPNIIGIKVTNPDQANLQKVIDLNGDLDFSILTATESLTVAGLQMGCDGFISGLTNICPQIAVALYKASQKGDWELARKLQRDFSAVWQLFRFGNVWGGFDEALRYLGIAERATAAPYISRLSDDEAKGVRLILDTYLEPYMAGVSDN